MIVLKPIGTAQTIKFIARVDACTSLVLRDEQNNTEATIVADFSTEDHYISDSLIFSLEEGKFYNLTAYNGSSIVYRDKIFCTAQTDTYTINSGVYTESSSNNDYITV